MHFAITLFSWIFNWICLDFFDTSFFLWYNFLLPVKYQTEQIKCLEMRAKIKPWWLIEINFLSNRPIHTFSSNNNCCIFNRQFEQWSNNHDKLIANRDLHYWKHQFYIILRMYQKFTKTIFYFSYTNLKQYFLVTSEIWYSQFRRDLNIFNLVL